MRAVIFDVGNVLYDWDIDLLYRRLIADDGDRAAFLRDVVTKEWHFQHDAGRPFAETSAELIARFPHHRDLIAAFGPRFNETVSGLLDGMGAIVEALDAAQVPLFAITNFSAEFWPPFRAQESAIFDRFQDIVVSGDERLSKPDPAIYHLAMKRFGIAPGEALFIDDRIENVRGAEAVGLSGHHFRDSATLAEELVRLGLLDQPR